MAAAKNKKSKKKTTTPAKSGGGDNNNNNKATDDRQELLEKTMRALEGKTGKKYKQREDLPSVKHMLSHGAPDDDRTETEKLREMLSFYAVILVLFLISLGVLKMLLPHLSSDGQPFRLPTLNMNRNQGGGEL